MLMIRRTPIKVEQRRTRASSGIVLPWGNPISELVGCCIRLDQSYILRMGMFRQLTCIADCHHTCLPRWMGL